MSLLKKLQKWCPQPKTIFPSNRTLLSKSSKSIFATALALEILLLLVVPIAYYAFLAPKPKIDLMQKFPLTTEQIRDSWPNLPTADQIIKDGVVLVRVAFPPAWVNFTNVALLGTVGSVMNATVLNVPDYHNGGVIPKSYEIWLQLNDTYIEVPNKYLATNNPPITPPEETGFLGSGLSIEYIVIALLVIMTTVILGINLLVRKRNSFPKTA